MSRVITQNGNKFTESASVPTGTVLNGEKTEKLNSILNNIKQKSNGKGYSYESNLDERIDSLIDDADISTKDMLKSFFGEDKEEQKKHLKAYIQAEYATMYPDLRSKDSIGTVFENEELQGAIQIKRENNNSGNLELLEYKPYNEFKQMLSNGDMDILNYFSLDVANDVVQLKVAKMNKTIIEKESNDTLMVEQWLQEGLEQSNITSTTAENGSTVEIAKKEEIFFSEVSLAYQNLVSPYSLSAQLIWSILTVSDDAKFAYDVANLVIGNDGNGLLNTKIIITVQDNETTTTQVDIENYKKEIQSDTTINFRKVLPYIDLTGLANFNIPSATEQEKKVYPTETTEEGDYYNKITTTTISNVTYMDVTYADTWVIEYTNEYTKENSGILTLRDEKGISVPDETDWSDEPTVEMNQSQNTQQEMISKVQEKYDNYREETIKKVIEKVLKRLLENASIGSNASIDTEIVNLINNNMSEIIDIIYYSQSNSDVFSKVMELLENVSESLNRVLCATIARNTYIGCYENSDILNNTQITINNLIIKMKSRKKDILKDDLLTQTNITYTKGLPQVKEKITDDTVNFITLFNNSTIAKHNLTSIPDWLFTFMSEHEETADKVDLMKWLLGIATGDERYQGITINWTSLISNTEYSSFGSGSGFADYLYQFSHNTAHAPMYEGIIDGMQFYKVYGDNGNGGLATVGNGDICIRDHHSAFNNEGYILENNTPKLVNVEIYLSEKLDANYNYNGEEIYIEKGFVDDISNTLTINAKVDVERYMNNEPYPLSLSQFSTQQQYAIISIYYARGKTSVQMVIDKIKELMYQRSIEKDSIEFNKRLWEEAWRKIDSGSEHRIYTKANDARFETYVKGVYDFSSAGGIGGREYKYYTKNQLRDWGITEASYLNQAKDSIDDKMFEYEEVNNVPGATEAARIAIAAAEDAAARRCAYVSGARGPDTFDCTGLIDWCYKQAGIDVPGWTGAYFNDHQWDADIVHENMNGLTDSELKENLLPGDVLVYYIYRSADDHEGHAVIYIGDNQFIHARNPNAVPRSAKTRAI